MDMTIALISTSVGFDELLLQTNKLKFATLTEAVACALLETTNLPQKRQKQYNFHGAHWPGKAHFFSPYS